MIRSNHEEGVLVEVKEEDMCTNKSDETTDHVKEENEIGMKNYKSIQTHFFQVLQQDEANKLKTEEPNRHEEAEEDPLLVSLSLGRTNSMDSSSGLTRENRGGFDKGLWLGLDSLEEPKKQEVIPEAWPPSKILKTTPHGPDEETAVKKARVSIRTRCDSQTMNDGCQWRKYGQKVAKGNPCPRAYYRCTISPTCPVRKQVQRCAEDMSILVTTYEGTHNHPLPPSATAVASTTSAAASMLKSNPSQSRFGSSISAPLSNSSTSTNGALSFSGTSWNQEQFYMSKSNHSMSTINSHPTVTLDLTSYNPSQYSTAKFPSSSPSFLPSRTTLSFSSDSSSDHYSFNTTSSWNSSAYNYGNSLRQLQHVYKPYNMQMANSNGSNEEKSLKESIAAATKMIASNPSFQSALAAAISSYVGCRGGNVRESHGLCMDQTTLNLNL